MNYSTRKTCRICDSDNLKTVLNLGEIHLSTFLGVDADAPPKAPIELVHCQDCDLAQLRHTVDPDFMYSDYWYQSGLNGSMVTALRDVVDSARQRVTLEPGDVIVDIGANDGTLLSNFTKGGLTRIAFEPNNLAEMGKQHCEILVKDYFNSEAFFKTKVKSAKLITAIAMFYDLEEPHKFVQDLKTVLHEDGIIIIQMMDLMSMLKYTDFMNLCHEHLEYYSLRVFVNLMKQHGLEVFDVEYNGVNGGSLRAYVRHDISTYNNELAFSVTPTVASALQQEEAYFNSLGNVYDYFRANVENVRIKINSMLHLLHEQGKKIAVMGASTKGNTLLQYFGINNTIIDHAAEVNPDKFGLRTVASNIPIISQVESLAQHPDYYLILPWGFIDNFVQKNMDYLKDGGSFIVPLPKPIIISYSKQLDNLTTWVL
jgi:hypothetical protein